MLTYILTICYTYYDFAYNAFSKPGETNGVFRTT